MDVGEKRLAAFLPDLSDRPAVELGAELLGVEEKLLRVRRVVEDVALEREAKLVVDDRGGSGPSRPCRRPSGAARRSA
jgi:hypothetical protein